VAGVERAKPEGLAYLEASWYGIDQVRIFGVDVWIVAVLFARWVVLDIEKLAVVVVGVSYAVFVISAVPDFSGGLLACCEGIAAFDVLNAY
jgi:hypothetical protein